MLPSLRAPRCPPARLPACPPCAQVCYVLYEQQRHSPWLGVQALVSIPGSLSQAFAVPPIRLPLPVITGQIRPPQGSLYLAVDPIFVWTPSSINSIHHHRLDLPKETSAKSPAYSISHHSTGGVGLDARGGRGRDGLAIPIRALDGTATRLRRDRTRSCQCTAVGKACCFITVPCTSGPVPACFAHQLV